MPPQIKFNSILSGASRSTEELESQKSHAAARLATLHDMADTVVIDGLFNDLPLDEHVNTSIWAKVTQDRRRWKVVSTTSLGQPPRKDGHFFSHPCRFFLVSDAGDVGYVNVDLHLRNQVGAISPGTYLGSYTPGMTGIVENVSRIKTATVEDFLIPLPAQEESYDATATASGKLFDAVVESAYQRGVAWRVDVRGLLRRAPAKRI